MTGSAIVPADFSNFFEEVHGVRPFPWQARLATQVCEEGWPGVLDLPTGAGKTAAIDVAVFHLALEASRGPDRRASPRILFVVDRRLVVDDAFERSRRIADALARRETPTLRVVADALASLAEDPGRPLEVARLRGGVPKEPDTIRTPMQPTVVVSTVDQVGSRLLFRGYGVSDSMRPVHAGLLGQDALWLLDEAHLAQPLVETLRGVADLRPTERRHTVERLPAVVTLSATPGEASESLLMDADRANAVLGPRIAASKPAELVAVRGGDDVFESSCVDRAYALSSLAGGDANVVAVVVNRVAVARRIHHLLTKRIAGEEPLGDVALLIGRCREADREVVLDELLPRMRAENRQPGRPLFVVATQTVEAGADLDFDALVTEVAPLDSLRQRFGRLNRCGRPIKAQSAIVARADSVVPKAKPDPLYGDSIKRTWAWLFEASRTAGKGKSARRFIDLGIDAAEKWLPEGEALQQCIAPRQKAPVLLPAFVDRWAKTSPVPVDDPEVALFLHGPRSGPADVQIVWRSDLDLGEDEALVVERVEVCPPVAGEAISLPYAEARRWLAGKAIGEISDLVVSPLDEAPPSKRSVLRWAGKGNERTKIIQGRDVRPGDLLVVPSSYGGCDRWGWNPQSCDPVTDIAEEVISSQRGIEVLRLSSVRCSQGDNSGGDRLAERMKALSQSSKAEILEELGSLGVIPETWRGRIHSGSVKLLRSQAAGGLPLALSVRSGRSSAAVTEDDESSAAPRQVSLPVHSRGVRDFAESFARSAGLPSAVVEDISLAAYLHDAGKAEPTFQTWLYGGDELAAAGGEPLAKSGRLRLDRASRERARLPSQARHEVASLYFALAHPLLAEANDPELVLWLVGTHHGWGRPFFPPVDWPPPGSRFEADLGDGAVESIRSLDAGELLARWVMTFERVHNRYGHWGLARLEAVLRLADHRRSEVEEKER